METPNLKAKLPRVWQPQSSGKIKIDKSSPVITLRASDWLTSRNGWGFSSPIPKNEKEKPCTNKTMSPLALWIDARCEPRNFPLAALHFQPLPFKSQTAHMPRAAGRATWQITAGLIIKNQHSPEGVAGEEEGYDGGGIPIKPTERPQTKERDEFLLLLLLLLLTTSKKNSFQLQMAAFWRGKKTHKKVNRNCSMCASVCTAPYIICIPIYLWFKKEAGRAERQPAERWRTAIVLLSCASVTRWPVSMLCCALSKTKPLYTASHPLSFSPHLFVLHYLCPSSPPFPSFLRPHPLHLFFFSPLANSQLSFLLCLLCLWSLIRKINDFVKCRSAAGMSCEMRRNTCMWNISQWTMSVCLQLYVLNYSH